MAYKGHGDLSGKKWGDIKYCAQRRGISFDENLTIEYAWGLFLEQNKKCAMSNLDIFLFKSQSPRRDTASLDRINSSIGYTKDNIWWLHKDVNNLKGSMSKEETVKLCKKIYLEDIKQNRQSWPEYFINMAYLVASRSRDPSTKCGCVITDKDYRVISTGYNGNFQGVDDTIFSWERPQKYQTVIHSEMNAILFANRSLKDCYAFITGIPCSNCCKHMIQSGIVKIYYGKNTAKMCNKEDETIVRNLCNIKNIELTELDI
jgi:dCMP deaminase